LLLQIIVAVAINKERPLLPPDTPPRLAALISQCWLEDPAARPRVSQLAVELQDMMQVGVTCFHDCVSSIFDGTACWCFVVLVFSLGHCAGWRFYRLVQPVLAGGPCCKATRCAAGGRAAGHDAGGRVVTRNFLLGY
jgi:hypothetical protein